MSELPARPETASRSTLGGMADTVADVSGRLRALAVELVPAGKAPDAAAVLFGIGAVEMLSMFAEEGPMPPQPLDSPNSSGSGSPTGHEVDRLRLRLALGYQRRRKILIGIESGLYRRFPALSDTNSSGRRTRMDLGLSGWRQDRSRGFWIVRTSNGPFRAR